MRVRLNSARDIRRTLTRVTNAALAGEIDTKRANTVIVACNAALGALRIEEEMGAQIEDNELIIHIDYGDGE